MIVTVSGLSGLTNAYRSELSATGSLLISGASRCEDISYGPFRQRSAVHGFEQPGGELLVGLPQGAFVFSQGEGDWLASSTPISTRPETRWFNGFRSACGAAGRFPPTR